MAAASSTETSRDGERGTTRERDRDSNLERVNDRLTLATYDQREAMQDWLEATVSLQREYLDWVGRTMRLFMPQSMFGQQD